MRALRIRGVTSVLLSTLVSAHAQTPSTSHEDTFSWAAHNRTMALQANTVHQHYREQDVLGRTTDGTLDSERGPSGPLLCWPLWC